MPSPFEETSRRLERAGKIHNVRRHFPHRTRCDARSFRDKLSDAINWLQPLFRDDCTGADPLTKGFRQGRMTKRVALSRYFGAGPAIRSSVQRADATWVHGRGRDSRSPRLLDSTVVVVGCGSVGAPVACLLAQGGIGRLVLVDYDTLSWPNVGRHSLGAAAVGRNKAEALAERLQPDCPHLQIEACASGLHGLLYGIRRPWIRLT